jgi:hypothetical protein
MEARLPNAVAIVDIDPGQAEEWFELVNGAYWASNDDWDKFSERLSATAGSAFGTAVEEFLRYAADHGKTELIGSLVADAREHSSAATGDGVLWDAVVRQFGAEWAGWDGSEAGWAQFRDWTYTAANTQSPEMYAAAYEKLNPLNGLAPAERIAKLAELGLAVDVSGPSAAAADSAELDEVIDEALAEALKEVPGSEALTAEEVAEIRAAIAEEIAHEAL